MLQCGELLPELVQVIDDYPDSSLAISGLFDMAKWVATLPFAKIGEWLQHGSQPLRRCIVANLWCRPSEDIESTLTKALSEDDLRYQAIRALARARSYGSGEEIAAWIGKEPRWVSDAAIRAAGQLDFYPASAQVSEILSALVERASQQELDSGDRNTAWECILCIGRIGGRSGVKVLESAWPHLDCKDAIVWSLLMLASSGGVRSVERLLGDHPSGGKLLAAALTRPDMDVAGPGWRFWNFQITSKVLAQLLCDHIRREIEDSQSQKTKQSDVSEKVRLSRLFDSLSCMVDDDCTALLREILTGAFATIDGGLRQDACEILAELGDDAGVRQVIRNSLRNIEWRPYVTTHDAYELSKYEPSVVREELRHGLNADRKSSTFVISVYLLRWFATEEDARLFGELETCGDSQLADLAHEFLVDRYRFQGHGSAGLDFPIYGARIEPREGHAAASREES